MSAPASAMDRTADDAVASPSTASSGASSKPSPHRGGKRKTADGRSYIELNLDQLNQLFGKAVKPADIQAAYRARSSDMQKAIDDLVERSGLHPELHSSFEAQQSLVSAASSSKLPSAASSSSSSTDASSSASSPTLKKARSTRLVFEQVQGDLFSSPSQSALVHCVSECLAMGKGIATIFKERFAGVDELKAQKKKIGDVAILKRDERYVYYLITKARYFNKPTLPDLERSLVAMRTHVIAHGVKLISMPRIGCGLDGLLWNEVKAVIVKVFDQCDVKIVVYTM